MRDTISVLEEAFREHALGGTATPARVSLSIPKEEGWMGVMPAYLRNLKALSTKVVTVFNRNASRDLPTAMATVFLCDPTTGEPTAMMEGSYITAFRTGGLGGLAAKSLSRKELKTVGMLGAGVQARTQLRALMEVRGVTHVKIHDILRERADTFAKEMRGKTRNRGGELSVSCGSREGFRYFGHGVHVGRTGVRRGVSPARNPHQRVRQLQTGQQGTGLQDRREIQSLRGPQGGGPGRGWRFNHPDSRKGALGRTTSWVRLVKFSPVRSLEGRPTKTLLSSSLWGSGFKTAPLPPLPMRGRGKRAWGRKWI